MNVRKLSVPTLGFAAGFLLWILSGPVTGEAEPWDAGSGFYWIGLILAGAIAALPSPGRFWMAPVGVYAGQVVAALLFLPLGPLWAVGVLFMAVFCLLSLLGAAVTFGVWKTLRTKIPGG